MYCPVYGCSSDSQKNPSGITNAICKRKEFDPSSSSRICSRHFSEDAYEPGHSPQFLESIECKETFRLRLKSDALPTLNKPLLEVSTSKPRTATARRQREKVSQIRDVLRC